MSTPPAPLRILHIGNVFLDRPIARLRHGTPERRREELREALSCFFETVEREHVSLVLITGNLVDNAFLTEDTVALLVRAFDEHKDTEFVITPGPADYFVKDEAYDSGRFPTNVHVIKEELIKAAIPNCNIDFEDGRDMKEDLKKYFELLVPLSPNSFGGKAPDDGFYYVK